MAFGLLSAAQADIVTAVLDGEVERPHGYWSRCEGCGRPAVYFGDGRWCADCFKLTDCEEATDAR